jgi:predicted nucleic acid-binding protein
VGLALLDSSTVIGYLDAEDLLHAEASAAIEVAMRSGTGLAISAVTWAELLHGAFVGYRDEAAVREFAVDFGVEVLPIDAAVAERAADLQASYAGPGRRSESRRLKTPDALILATADLDTDVEFVICGEDKWPKIGGLRHKVSLIRERRR